MIVHFALKLQRRRSDAQLRVSAGDKEILYLRFLFLLLLLHLLIEPCPVFYPICLFFYNADVQSHFRGCPDNLFSIFYDFRKSVIIHPVYMLPLHARLLILAHLMTS